MNIVSLFFYFYLALLSGIASYASDPDIVPSSTDITPAGSVATSFRSTPRLSPAGVGTSEIEGEDSGLDLDRFLAVSIQESDESAVLMKGPLSPPSALDTSCAESEGGDDDSDASALASPLNLHRKDTILTADDQSIHHTCTKRFLKMYTIQTAQNGTEAIALATEAASSRTPIKLFLLDFRMGHPDGGQTALRIRDIEFAGQKPFLNSIYVCVSSTPDDAKPYLIKDLDNCFSSALRKPEEVFHDVREKINTPQRAQDVISFANALLSKLASQQLGLLDGTAVSAK